MPTSNFLYAPVMLAGGILLFIMFMMLMGCSGPTVFIAEEHVTRAGIKRMDVRLACGPNTGSWESPKYVCDLKFVHASETEYWRNQ